MSPIVWHLVDAMGDAGELWGKERTVAEILLAQRAGGARDARLICFTPGALSRYCLARGIPVEHLEERPRRIPSHSLPVLLRILAQTPGAVLHTHGYKANIVGRVARLGGAPVSRVVATCHGWPNETFATRTYNVLDRWSAFLSDVTTVPDAAMVTRFPAPWRRRTMLVANAIPDGAMASPAERAAARRSFGWEDAFVAGLVGRISEGKGTRDALAAAANPCCAGVEWAFAGEGPLQGEVAQAGPAARCVGYLASTAPFLNALDVFVQASHSEGLSLALLEAMRAGLPIVATTVGATTAALRDGVDALLISPREPDALARAVAHLRADADLRARLAAAARERFERNFRVDRQVGEFARAYGRSA
jgi:glycosyltransferase involved in cell wall biosynthesis